MHDNYPIIMEKINILYACDLNYVMPLSVSLTSVFENNSANHLNVYILHSPLPDEEKQILINLAKSYNQNIYLIHVDEHYFEDAPIFTWAKTTYYRLLINEYIPKDLKKIIYLDCDTITNKPLNGLYNLDFDGCHLIAAEEKQPAFMIRLGLNPKDSYFQTGVMLIDLEKFRELVYYEKVSEIISKLGKEMHLLDEAVLNIIFYKKIKPLEQKYNNYFVTNFKINKYNRLFNIVDKKMIDETHIFHFTNKPWNKLYTESCEKIWYKYLLLSPYKDLYRERYNTFKYRLLRTGILKSIVSKITNQESQIDLLMKRYLPEKLREELKKFYFKKIKNEISRVPVRASMKE